MCGNVPRTQVAHIRIKVIYHLLHFTHYQTLSCTPHICITAVSSDISFASQSVLHLATSAGANTGTLLAYDSGNARGPESRPGQGDHKGAPLLCLRSGLPGSSKVGAHPCGRGLLGRQTCKETPASRNGRIDISTCRTSVMCCLFLQPICVYSPLAKYDPYLYHL